MQKQLLWLMYIMSNENIYLHEHPRQTRNAHKIVFKVPTRVLPSYERSPYYIGSKLWNVLDIDTQRINNVFAFKKKIAMCYVEYKAI